LLLIVINYVENYVDNDIEFNKNKTFYYLSFLNWWGKSTYLRWMWLNQLLFQIGFPICSDYIDNEVEIVDNIYARIWANDDLINWESTFVKEMLEMKNIFKECSKNSLLLIDEIWRWTDNKSWLAIAKWITEYLINNKIKTIFSTHYHELHDLIKSNNNAVPLIISESWDNNWDIIFNFKLKEWYSETSHWYYVAKKIWLQENILNLIKKNI